jgi:cell division protease FtsH
VADTRPDQSAAESSRRRRRDKTPAPRPPLAPQPEPESRKRQVLVILAGVLAIGLMLAIPLVLLNRPEHVTGRTLSDVLAAIDTGVLDDQPVVWTEIDDNSRAVILTLANGDEVAANYPDYFGGSLVARLEASGIPFETDAIATDSIWPTVALTLLPVVLIIGFLFWFLRRSGVGGAGAAKAFTTTKAEVGSIPASRFVNVVGCDEVVDELSEIVNFLHDPTPFRAAGANIPRGFLLVGPPGTGKTLLARAVAGEAGVPFYAASGSDFTEMFVGVGAARVRDLFTKAKKTGGIVFIDELDSVGRIRSGAISGGGGTDEREGTLNALLVEMDGFGKDANVIVIAATNRPDVLDPALLRAGRFDRQITVPAPDRRGRTSLLSLYAADRRLDPAVDLVGLARRMPGLTGADIANVVNQAALAAARDKREALLPADFDEALATVMMGRARRSAVVPERDRDVTAWHEAGHAVVALALPEAHDPVQVTIVPRGNAGGVTWMGGDDHAFLTRSQAHARLAVSLGGRAGEELLLDGDFTQGASGDLQTATALAFRMVTEWGMSGLGLAAMGPEHAEPGLVRGEVDRLLGEALDTARRVLAEQRPLLDSVVAELLDEETIDGDRLAGLWAGGVPVAAIDTGNRP